MRSACPTPLPHTERIVMGHGSGGRLTQQLIESIFYPLLDNPVLAVGDDSALPGPDSGQVAEQLGEGRLALTTDAHMNFLQDLEDKSRQSAVHNLMPYNPAEGCLVTNLSRMPVKKLNFGTGERQIRRSTRSDSKAL